MRGRPVGYKHSEETKKRISEARLKQHLPGNKGMLGKKHSPEVIEKIRLASTGKKKSSVVRMKIGLAHFGRKYSKELIENNRQAILRPEVRLKKALSRKGEKSHFWKGGLTDKNRLIRESLEYKQWREQVFKRDNYQCVYGGKSHGRKLQAHHIKPFAFYPELRFEVFNGITLCECCHKKTDSFAKRVDVSVLKGRQNRKKLTIKK